MIEPLPRSPYRPGELIERALPWLVGIVLAVWLALTVASGIKAAFARAEASLAVAAAKPV
jgi:hypothetical protein